MAPPLFACEGIVKSFGGVRALRGVDFTVRAGRVHALVGENGAGKSTLAKIIAGLYPADAGRLALDGQPLALSGTRDALKRGIVTVHQDINLIPSQTVAENIFLANEPTRGPFGIIRQGELHARTSALLERYGIGCRPGTLVADLPNDQKKMVQILKAISREARILLLDEPTSSLTDVELRLVLRLIRELAGQGTGIVFISHYLSEVFEVADDITVLRDGSVALSTLRAETAIGQIVSAMIGRHLTSENRARDPAPLGKPLLDVRDLSVRNGPRGVGFTLHEGEVLGITGLTGSGLTELAKAIFASPDVRRDSGTISLRGQPLNLRTPRDALAAGIALLTNDRLREGILPESPIDENVALPVLGRFADRFGVLDLSAMRDAGARAIERLRIRAPGPSSPAKSLSGGNQQKVLLAKWLGTHPQVFIMDEPTIGIDVGSKAEIREQVRQIAGRGVGVILITAEIDELTTLCDRVLIMFRGKFVAELSGHAIDRQTILQTSVSGELAA